MAETRENVNGEGVAPDGAPGADAPAAGWGRGDVTPASWRVLGPGPARAAHVAPDALCRAYSEAGIFLGILRYRGEGRWRPEKVFAAL